MSLSGTHARTEGEWITFDLLGRSRGGRTFMWAVNAKGAPPPAPGQIRYTEPPPPNLGHVAWHGPWRKYCFFTSAIGERVFEHRCLRDIAEFIELETRAHFDNFAMNHPAELP